ncbi:MAG: molybdopterin-synthase adenylyltransferase MoeB [Bradymonadia bacterium]
MSRRDLHLSALRARIPEISPATTQALDGTLVDVRTPEEWSQGSPEGAVRLGRDALELQIEDHAPDLDTPVVVMCASGRRSLLAADDLLRLGYTDVRSMAGGFTAWKAQGLPIEIPQQLGADLRARYHRHLLMPEVGEAGQRTLLKSRVLLVGLGGLGSPAALYLAAAGVGHLGLVDDDVVDRSNLQRQVIHVDHAVGRLKVDSAIERLTALNPQLSLARHPYRLTAENAAALISGEAEPDGKPYDLVIDGADNFTARYTLNDACAALGVPCVHGSVHRFEGQVSVFAPPKGPCYRCLFPHPPPPELAPNCATAGVLGVLPGVIGLLQATEALKLLLGVGEPLVGRLLAYDGLKSTLRQTALPRDPACPTCSKLHQ